MFKQTLFSLIMGYLERLGCNFNIKFTLAHLILTMQIFSSKQNAAKDAHLIDCETQPGCFVILIPDLLLRTTKKLQVMNREGDECT